MARLHMLPVLAAAALLGLPAMAQQRVSPHEQTSVTIDGKKITIEYGRPYMKGRKIFGGLVPLGEVWRAGADEATVLTTDADLTIGSLRVPKGSYALFVIPQANAWTLVVNKVAKQWGAFNYDQSKDLGRTPMKVTTSGSPIEQFTISLETAGPKRGVLKMAWERTVATADFSVD
ncbi:MAG TPA: DUF2911 domain-containing protein [Bryobacterales bacterium]|jgi:hypothetical protein|nr:DUF2911 domain-containing protein [Bryobacterales bacterium]